MKINKKELIVGNTAYVVTKKYDPNQTKQVYHYDPTGPMAEHWQKILEYEKDNY